MANAFTGNPSVFATIGGHTHGKLPIERFFPILQLFAEMWRKDVYACCNACHALEDPEKDKAIIVHFFCKGTALGTNQLYDSVFGYKIAAPIPSCTPAHFYPLHLHDFRGRLLAHVEGNNSISIDFDILDPRWQEQEDVLLLILFYCLPEITAHQNNAELKKHAGRKFSLWLRQRCHIDYKSFGRVLEEISLHLVKGHLDRLIEAAGRTVWLESELLTCHQRIVHLESYLDWLASRPLDEKTPGDQFDTILRFNGVDKVETINEIGFGPTGEKTFDRIVITTDRILHSTPFSVNGRIGNTVIKQDARPHRDVGTFEITIEPRFTSRGGISTQQKDPGKYRHYYVNQGSGSICFGNLFNSLIDKAMFTGDILGVVSLIITFLREAEGTPHPLSSDAAPEEYLPEAPVKHFEPEAYAKTRQDFISMLQRSHLEKLGSDARASLSTFRSREEDLSKMYTDARSKKAELESFQAYLKERAILQGGEEKGFYDAVLNHPCVAAMEAKAGLRIWVCDEDKIPYPILLWIQPDGPPKLITNLSFPGKGYNHEMWWLREEDRIKNYLINRDFVAIVEYAMNMVSAPPSVAPSA